MTASAIKQTISDDMKAAMRAKEKQRLGVIRLALAAIKQQEVDTRTELDDTAVLAVLDKMVKQRRDSLTQYENAGREDLAQQERYEIEVLQTYLPAALGDEELEQLIKEAISSSGAASMQDMGKVMNELRPKVQGRADMGQVSQKVKALLG
ncbi:GatB/YqeY domain-containing protein [Kaarinaea lacus]